MGKRMIKIEKVGEMRLAKETESYCWSRAFDSTLPINPESLGNKGASLAEMVRLKLPVPPGFTLTTDVWRSFEASDEKLPDEIWQEAKMQIKELEIKTGKKFGDKKNPLIVSVRSGGKFSMPGMLDTFLNIGINDDILEGLAQEIGKEATDMAYKKSKEIFLTTSNGQRELPQDPYIQLHQAIEAVLVSWNNPRAIDYRKSTGIPHDKGTAVTIQQMVWGNIKDGNSGSGVVFSCNPHTGKKEMWGEFVLGAQGIEVVSGFGNADSIKKTYPWYTDLLGYVHDLEKHHKKPQDIEFTVEKGKLWLLQSRTARLSPLAAVMVAYDMFKGHIISKNEAIQLVRPEQLSALRRPIFDPEEEEKARQNHLLIARGKSVSPGAVVGPLALTKKRAEELRRQVDPVNLRRQIKPVIVCHGFDPNDVKLVFNVGGIGTAIGGTASHMGIIIREAQIPGVVGCKHLEIDQKEGKIYYNGSFVSEGKIISMDGTTGEIFRDAIKLTRPPKLPIDLHRFLESWRRVFGKSPWGAALYPTESHYRRVDYLQRIKNLLPELRKWKSAKAQEVIILNHLLPKKDIIQGIVKKPDDTESIREALLNISQMPGYENIPRTGHYPERLAGAPYAIVGNNPKSIKDFLTNPSYPGRYGGLQRWRKDPTLEAVIVAAEPEGKLDPDLYSQHFAFTISFVEPSKIVIDLNLGTPLLRSFEEIEPGMLIQVTASINPETPYFLGQITLSFGEKHLNADNIDKLTNLASSREEADGTLIIKILKLLSSRCGEEEFDSIKGNTQKITNLILKTMDEGLLTDEMYKFLIKPNVLSVARLVSAKVFEEWWRPPFSLPHVVAAIDDTLGFSVLEGQGRIDLDEDKLRWCLVYGAKGREEKEKVKKAKRLK